MSKEHDNPAMSPADLSVARAAGAEHMMPDSPLSADELRQLHGEMDELTRLTEWPQIPRQPTFAEMAVGQAMEGAAERQRALREHRSNAMYYAALLRPDTQEVFQHNEVEETITDAKRIFRYIWDGE